MPDQDFLHVIHWLSLTELSLVKPGSHMSSIYLGHRYGRCEHLSPNHDLSQALTAGKPSMQTFFGLVTQSFFTRGVTILKNVCVVVGKP